MRGLEKLAIFIAVASVPIVCFTFDDQHSSVAYSGNWIHWKQGDTVTVLEKIFGISLPPNSTVSIADASSANASLSFQGTSINISAYKSMFGGTMAVILDDQTPETVDLRSDSFERTTVYQSPVLASGSHSMKVFKSEENTPLKYINIDAFIVDESPTQSFPSQAAVSLGDNSSEPLQPSFRATPISPSSLSVISSVSPTTVQSEPGPYESRTNRPVATAFNGYSTPPEPPISTSGGATNQTKRVSSKKIGVIAGSICGIFVLLLIAMACVYVYHYRERRRREQKRLYGCSEKTGGSDPVVAREMELVCTKLDSVAPPPYPGPSS